MSKARSLAFLITMIGVAMVLSSVDAQSTVDDSAWCESSTLYAAVNVIREEFESVKNFLGSNQQQNDASAISKKDLEDLKATCASNHNNETAISRKDLEDLKVVCASNQLNNETTTCISREDLEDLKASIQQLSRPLDLSTQDPISSLSCEYRTLSYGFDEVQYIDVD